MSRIPPWLWAYPKLVDEWTPASLDQGVLTLFKNRLFHLIMCKLPDFCATSSPVGSSTRWFFASWLLRGALYKRADESLCIVWKRRAMPARLTRTESHKLPYTAVSDVLLFLLFFLVYNMVVLEKTQIHQLESVYVLLYNNFCASYL